MYAAARLLCANGGANGTNLSAAVFAYNHDRRYVAEVLELAQSYGQGVAEETSGRVAVEWALAQVGTPYAWGGERSGVGFDCSGLVQAAYWAAGVSLPRTAQEQFDAGPQLPARTPLEPGDLVFFGTSRTDVSHVGIYVGSRGAQAFMVDAPRHGVDVRVESFPMTVGAAWGADIYLGATRPGR